MNLSNRDFLNNKDAKLTPNKITSLNPNAAEFIPSAFKFSVAKTQSSDVSRWDGPGPSAKSILDRSESNVSNKSDDDAQRYWRDQLPDDITPDFKSMGEDELYTTGELSLATLSLHDGVETSRFLTSGNNQLFGTEQEISPRDIGNLSNLNFGEKAGYLGSTFVEDKPSNSFMTLAAAEWEKSFINGGQPFMNGSEGHHYNGDSSSGVLNASLTEYAGLEDAAVNPVGFLTSLFPGFAAESLADVYYANGCDLNLTIEMLTQLEVFI